MRYELVKLTTDITEQGCTTKSISLTLKIKVLISTSNGHINATVGILERYATSIVGDGVVIPVSYTHLTLPTTPYV